MSCLSDENYSRLNKICDCLQSFVADTSVLSSATATFVSAVTIDENNSTASPNLLSSEKITQPNSIVEFQKRISSFKFGSWTVSGLSPLLCARHGWKLKSSNILQCVTCHAFICTSLPPASQYNAYIEFLNLLKKRLKCSHKDWCGWSFNQCPEKYACPPLAFSVHYIEYLQKDIKVLSSHSSKLPLINISKHLLQLNLEKWQFHILLDNQNTHDDDMELTAALLVLVGWRYEKKDYLSCSVCLRKIGLWRYTPLRKKNEYLSLKERHLEKQKRRDIQEAARKKKEEARRVREEAINKLEAEKLKIKQEEERKKQEIAEKEAKEEAMKIMIREERQKMFEAINYEQLIDLHMNDVEEEVDETEEQVLLKEVDVNFSNINESENSPETNNSDKDTSLDNKDAENGAHKDGHEVRPNCKFIETENEISENLHTGDELCISSCNNKFDNDANNEDDLWLEAVGCENVTDKPTSSLSDVSEGEREKLSECSESPELLNIQQPLDFLVDNSHSGILATKKRRRSDSNSDSSDRNLNTESLAHQKRRRSENDSDSSDRNLNSESLAHQKRQRSDSDSGSSDRNINSESLAHQKRQRSDSDSDSSDRNLNSESLAHQKRQRSDSDSGSSDRNINSRSSAHQKRQRSDSDSDSSDRNLNPESVAMQNQRRKSDNDFDILDQNPPIELATQKRRNSSSSLEQSCKRFLTGEKVIAQDDYMVDVSMAQKSLEQKIINLKTIQVPELQQKNIKDSDGQNISVLDDEMNIEEDTDEDHVYSKMNKAIFDPFEEHRSWCGWLSKFSSSDDDREKLIPGYLILSEQLKNILPQTQSSLQKGGLLKSESYSNIIEGLRTIRSTISEWQLELPEESI